MIPRWTSWKMRARAIVHKVAPDSYVVLTLPSGYKFCGGLGSLKSLTAHFGELGFPSIAWTTGLENGAFVEVYYSEGASYLATKPRGFAVDVDTVEIAYERASLFAAVDLVPPLAQLPLQFRNENVGPEAHSYRDFTSQSALVIGEAVWKRSPALSSVLSNRKNPFVLSDQNLSSEGVGEDVLTDIRNRILDTGESHGEGMFFSPLLRHDDSWVFNDEKVGFSVYFRNKGETSRHQKIPIRLSISGTVIELNNSSRFDVLRKIFEKYRLRKNAYCVFSPEGQYILVF